MASGLFRSVGICMLLLINTYNTLGNDVIFVTNISPPGIYSSYISLANDTELNFTSVLPSSSGLGKVYGLDYDPYTSTIYWSDVTTETIERYSLVNKSRDIVMSSVDGVQGIAIDDVERKIYWTSNTQDRIEVMNLDGSERTVLIDTGLSDPRGITIDSKNRYVYWTDWGTRMIERANLDDLNNTRTSLITPLLKQPNGLALADGKMYWSDSSSDYIEEANLNGTDRRIVARLTYSSAYPFYLDIYGDYVYWTDWSSAIYRVKRSGGTPTLVSSDSRLSIPGGIYIKKGPCELECENGGTCVNKYGVESCDCPYGFTGTNCQIIVGYCPCQ